MHISIFLSIVLTAYGGIHYFLYNWLVRMAGPSRFLLWVLRLVFLCLAASFPLTRTISHYDSSPSFYAFNLIAYTWMGLCIYFFFLALLLDLLRGILWIIPSAPRPFADRSLFWRRVLIFCVAAGVLAIGSYAVREARNPGVTRVDIPLRGLPPEMNGFTLVQISDVHYGILTRNGRLAKIVEGINELHPDVVVITGDLVDRSVSNMEEMAIPLSRLQGRLGVFAVLGNHEYMAGVGRVSSILRKSGIVLLRNRVQELPGGLQILGIDDPTGSRRMGEPAQDFERILSSVNPQKPSILLYHQPIRFEKAASCGIGLQLSGHTHGGQLFPFLYISRMFYPLTPGLHQIEKSFLYVSRGVGTWGPPMRLASPPEIVLVRLIVQP